MLQASGFVLHFAGCSVLSGKLHTPYIQHINLC